jgi:diguanylate cyclase (GGDEF)-like protein
MALIAIVIFALRKRQTRIFSGIPDAIAIVDRNARVVFANDRARELLQSGLRERLAEKLGALGEGEGAAEFAEHFPLLNRWVDVRLARMGGQVLVFGRDVTDVKKHELVAKDNERRLQLLLSQIPAVLFTLDLEMRITSLAGNALSDDRLSENQLVGAPFEVLLAEQEQKLSCVAAIRRVLSGEAVSYELRRQDRVLQSDVEPLRDAGGSVVGAIGVMLDVTDVRANAERFAEMARRDALTGLPNRMGLEEGLPGMLSRATENNESVAVMFLDLDRFKTINDTLGHRVGDQLLRATAQRMRERLDENATIYRPGGDEFVIVLDRVRHKRTIAKVTMDLLQAFADPFEIEGRELFVTPSVGASIFPQNATTADELIAFADSAMYRAKESGRNNAKFYDGTMHAHVLERMGLEQDLRQALARKELRLLFQPIVEMSSRRVVAAEALLRWRHPLLGELAPPAFIPIAEETGLIVDISRWALREACANAAQVRREGNADFRASVNLSPRDFYEQDLATTLAAILAETGLPAEALDIEVTENVVLNDLALETLQRIAEMNVGIVVDDFGTGYSALNYIKRLPVKAIKIDKAFIDDVAIDAYDQGIVKAVATLGQTLGLRVIAEGVESQAQYDFLRSLNCEFAQGFFFHRPAGWASLVAILRQNPKPPAMSSNRVIPLYGSSA